jgi:hypothetical protein
MSQYTDGVDGFGSGWDDGSVALAESKAMVLDFYHVPSSLSVVFKAFINSFSDQYTSEWNTEAVYGRMDPIAAFQGTARQISLEWDVVAGSISEAKLNMQKCETLMAMLYPSYSGASGQSQTIASSPLFRFKFGNFAHNVTSGPGAGGARAKDAGLVGFIGGFTFEPDFEQGIVDEGVGEFYPLKLTLSAEFTVLHTHAMGWTANSDHMKEGATMGLGENAKGFPYTTPGGTTAGATAAPAIGSASGLGGTAGGASSTGAGSAKNATEGMDPSDDIDAAAAHDMGMGGTD